MIEKMPHLKIMIKFASRFCFFAGTAKMVRCACFSMSPLFPNRRHPKGWTPNKPIRFCALFLLCGLLCKNAIAQNTDPNALLIGWLNAQTNIQTWSADFIQTRRLKALTQPLTATGHVWFAAPNRFRWEIEKPSSTMAIRQSDTLWVLYPRLKRAEKYPLDAANSGPWKDTLALLDAGFPRSREEVESRFNILSQNTTAEGVHEVTLQPKAATARRFMPEIKIGFETNNFSLHETVLGFADGSTMENIFSNARMNPKIEESLFNPDVAGYKISEPFKK
jgi:outer membrane lipoprotein-sorting protein